MDHLGLRNVMKETVWRSQAITKETNQTEYFFLLLHPDWSGLYSCSKSYRSRRVPVDQSRSHTMRMGPVLPTGWHTLVQCFTNMHMSYAGCWAIWYCQLDYLDRLRVIRVTTTKQDKLTIQNGVRWWKCHIYLLQLMKYESTRSRGAFRAPTPSCRPIGPLDFVLRALWAFWIF